MTRLAVAALAAAILLVPHAGAEELDAPISMADPNGQDLILERLDVRLAAHGPIALTELELRFRNPESRQVEGRFACNLPPGATVSRFAKEVGKKLMEGEVVERLKAKRVYTEILHTMRDPALLEQDQGNRFQARIFPIPARSTVRLLLSYTTLHPVRPDGTREIAVPLNGIQMIGEFRFHGIVRTLPGETVTAQGWLGTSRRVETGARVVFSDEAAREDFTPDQDLTLRFEASEDAPREHVVRAGGFRMVTFRPRVPGSAGVETPAEWVVYVDTSASAAPSPKPRLDAIDATLAALEKAQPGARIRLLAFDLGVHELGRWSAGDGGRRKAMQALRSRRFLGATDLGKTLAHIATQARVGKKSPRSFVLVSDSVPTLGARKADELARRLEGFPTTARLHVLAVGSLIEERVSKAVAEKGRGRVISLPLTDSFREHAARAVAELRRPPGASFRVTAGGAEWVQPDFFEDVRDGQELVAFVKGGKKAVRFERLGSSGHAVRAKPVDVPDFAPLLERQAYKAFLAHLEREEGRTDDARKKQRLRRKQLEISLEHRVLCPLTSMLVLETERDYVRFDIDRRALKDIMVIGKSGIELRKRKSHIKPKPRPKQILRTLDEDKRVRDVRKVAKRMVARPTAFRAPARSTGSGDLSARLGMAQGYGGAPGGSAGEPMEGLAMESMDMAVADGAPPPPAPAPRPSMEVSGISASDPYMDTDAPDSGAATHFNGGGGDGGDDDLEADEAEEHSRVEAIAERRRESVSRRPPAKRRAPSWTEQATWRPDAKLLKVMKKKVTKKPRDRARRNSYAWALKKAGDWAALRDQAFDWQPYDPRNPMVYEYLGVAFDNLDDAENALRAFSTIAEISPGDSGLLNRAGFLAFRAEQYDMARTLFEFAIERRPEHQNNYRGLALTLWALGKHSAAVDVYRKALKRNFNSRYGNVKRILREEAAYLLRSWRWADDVSERRLKKVAKELQADLDRKDEVRITLHWETDANDVDLHVVDPRGEESYYSHKTTASGVTLYADLTQGLGPECTVVPEGKRLPGTYHVGVKYFAAGPMGVSRGIVVIQRPSGSATPDVSIHPFTLLPDVAGRKQDMRHVAVEE